MKFIITNIGWWVSQCQDSLASVVGIGLLALLYLYNRQRVLSVLCCEKSNWGAPSAHEEFFRKVFAKRTTSGWGGVLRDWANYSKAGEIFLRDCVNNVNTKCKTFLRDRVNNCKAKEELFRLQSRRCNSSMTMETTEQENILQGLCKQLQSSCRRKYSLGAV